MSTTIATSHPAQQADTSRRSPRLFEILPLPAPSMSIFSSNLCLPGLLTALVTCLLFYVSDNPDLYFRVVAYYIVLMILVLFYQSSYLEKRALSLMIAGAIVAGLIWSEPVLNAFIYVFRELPGIAKPAGAGFAENFAYYFVGAGLMEELIKGVPALIGLLLVVIAGLLSRGQPSGWLIERFGVITPMQGLMMGLAAGGAFTLVETLEQYVPNLQTATAVNVATAIQGAFDESGTDPALQSSMSSVVAFAAQKTGLVEGFFLLMPRILGALIGHMSYAGIFGYFIGLAGKYRGVWMVPLLVFGWVLASTIHASWNSVEKPFMLAVVGVVSFVVFFTYYLKAFPELPGSNAARN